MTRHFGILTNVDQMVHRLNIDEPMGTKSSVGSTGKSFRETLFTDLEGKYQTLLLQMCLKVRGFELDVLVDGRGSSPVRIYPRFLRLIGPSWEYTHASCV